MPQPRVTVLMSVYNGGRFLSEAVESILKQTMPDYEFIVFNDGSTDATAEILASYDDPRLRIVHQENAGLAVTLNRGLELAHTELVARLDADDVARPDRLAKQLAEYERLGKPDVMGGAIELISETSRFLGYRYFPGTHNKIVCKLLAGRPSLAHPTVLYKRKVVLLHGGYDEFFRNTVEDYDLWLRMADTTRFANSRQILVALRLVSGSMSHALLPASQPHSTCSWFHCVAKQRYLMHMQHGSQSWAELAWREAVLGELWERFVTSGRESSDYVQRCLALIREDLLTPRRRFLALRHAAILLKALPIPTMRYVATRKLPEPRYLTHDEVLALKPAPVTSG